MKEKRGEKKIICTKLEARLANMPHKDGGDVNMI